MPVISIDDLLASPPENKPSLIGSGLLPEHGLLLLLGKTGVGKSVICGDIAMSLVLKEPLFRAYRRRNGLLQGDPYFPVHQECKVLYFDAEVGRMGLFQRFSALRATRCPGLLLDKRLEFCTEATETLMLLQRGNSTTGWNNLRTIIGDHRPSPDSNLSYVVIFDPLGDFHEIDENDSNMRLVFRNIKKLQAELGFACIVAHHESDRVPVGPNGPITRQGTQKSRGHSSITQVQDTIITLDREDDSNGLADLHLKWPKTRHCRRPPSGMLFVDYEKMYVDWYGPSKGLELKTRLLRRQDYASKHSISPDE